MMAELNGNVCLIGTPAEEGGAGKVKLLRNGAAPTEIRSAIESAILQKPSEHRFYLSALEGEPEHRKMSQIGG